MDDTKGSINQKFTDTYYISWFYLPAAISSTRPGSEWVYQMTADSCVTAQPSHTLHRPGSKAVTYSAVPLSAESKSKYQACRHLQDVQGSFEQL
jgi:hypothetical protein